MVTGSENALCEGGVTTVVNYSVATDDVSTFTIRLCTAYPTGKVEHPEGKGTKGWPKKRRPMLAGAPFADCLGGLKLSGVPVYVCETSEEGYSPGTYAEGMCSFDG